jgi:hypothetical protein
MKLPIFHFFKRCWTLLLWRCKIANIFIHFLFICLADAASLNFWQKRKVDVRSTKFNGIRKEKKVKKLFSLKKVFFFRVQPAFLATPLPKAVKGFAACWIHISSKYVRYACCSKETNRRAKTQTRPTNRDRYRDWYSPSLHSSVSKYSENQIVSCPLYKVFGFPKKSHRSFWTLPRFWCYFFFKCFKVNYASRKPLI